MKKLTLKIVLVLTVFWGLFLSFAHAQNVDTNSKAELEIREKARKRLYPGGKDEEPLKVQLQLIPPTRKFAPMTGFDEPATGSSQDD